jgi:hypothetical protein
LALNFDGDFKKLIVLDTQLLVKINDELLQNLGAWIHSFEDSVTESPKTSLFVFFAFLQKCRDILHRAYILEDSDALLSCTTMLWAPERSNAC